MINNFYAGGNLVDNVKLIPEHDFLAGTIAQTLRSKNGDKTIYLPFVFFGKNKDAFMQYGQKGRSIFLEGTINTRKDKNNHDVLSLNVRRWELFGGGNNRQEKNDGLDYGF